PPPRRGAAIRQDGRQAAAAASLRMRAEPRSTDPDDEPSLRPEAPRPAGRARSAPERLAPERPAPERPAGERPAPEQPAPERRSWAMGDLVRIASAAVILGGLLTLLIWQWPNMVGLYRALWTPTPEVAKESLPASKPKISDRIEPGSQPGQPATSLDAPP